MQERWAGCLLCNPRGVRLFIASDSPAKKGGTSFLRFPEKLFLLAGTGIQQSTYTQAQRKLSSSMAQSPSSTDRVVVGMVSLGQSITRL